MAVTLQKSGVGMIELTGGFSATKSRYSNTITVDLGEGVTLSGSESELAQLGAEVRRAVTVAAIASAQASYASRTAPTYTYPSAPAEDEDETLTIEEQLAKVTEQLAAIAAAVRSVR